MHSASDIRRCPPPARPRFAVVARLGHAVSTAWRASIASAAIGAAALLPAGPAHAQGAAAPPLNMARALDVAEHSPIQAVRLGPDEHIVLDGTLSHPAWRRAPVFDQFVEKDPVAGSRPKYETRVQVLYDDAAVYVGVTALDDHPEAIQHPLVRHDGVIRTQDFVMVVLDPIGKRQSAQFFRVGAGGSMGDGLYNAADDSEDFSPDFDFDAAAALDAHGYTAVLRIPFASLRFTGGASGHWRMMVVRRLPREQFHLWASVPIPVDAPAFIATLQPLQGLDLPASRPFLTVRPSITVRRSSSADSGAPATHDAAVEGSLDVKWRPLPELVLDGTLKPDFSQVALDVPQLSGNSSFALYLPEKRPFFFESSDLLAAPTQALYTRSYTAPKWGLRSTWRGQDVAGAAFLIDDRGGGTTLLPGAYGTGTALQPGSRSLAARVHDDIDAGNDLTVGGVLAARRYDQERGDNDVFGPDLSLLVPGGWHFHGQWLHSQTTAQPDAQGGLSRGPLSRGDFVYANIWRQDDRTEADFTVSDSGPGFRHDSGFFNQAGVRALQLHQGLAFRQLSESVNELWFNFNEGQTRDHVTGEVVQQYLTPGLWLAGAHNVEWSLRFHALSDLRVASGAPLLHEHYLQTDFTFSPSTWLPLVNTQLSIGRLADYAADRVRPGGQWSLSARTRPLASLELEPSLWMAWLRHDGVQAYRESATQLLAVWHLDAQQNLRAILQRHSYDRKAEPGVDPGRDSGAVLSLTYGWRRSMGTVLYVGVTHSRQGVGSVARGSEAFVKLQADIDEVRSLF